MKHLNEFLHFDIDSFLKDKTLMSLAVKDWFDFDDGRKKLGVKVECIITKDSTPYRLKAGAQAVETNRFEKLTIKVPKDITVPPDTYIVPVNAKATVYGEYRNMLSVTADDIKVLQPKKGA